jgi:hypothetical protein
MILGTVAKPLLLELVLADRDPSKFPRVTIYTAAGAPLLPIAMTAVPGFAGLYQASWPVPTQGHFTAAFEVFDDAGFTSLSDHEPGVEHVRVVTDFELALLKLLAHQGENVRDEVLTADPGTGRPLTARRKLYATKADALADVNVIATIDVTAAYPGPSTWDELVRVLT